MALIAFVLIEARTAEPLLPLRIFADRTRAGVYLILLCLASAFFGFFFFLTQYLQVVWGYSPLKSGLAYLPFIGAFIVVAGISSKLVNRVGARPLMTVGAVIAPVGLFWLSRVHEGSHYLTGVALPLMVFAVAAGLIFVPLTMTLVAGVSDRDSGVASSMFNAGQQVGGSLGLAIIGTVAWTVVNNRLRSVRTPQLHPRPVLRGHQRDADRRLRLPARPGDHPGRHQGPPRGPAGRPGGHVAAPPSHARGHKRLDGPPVSRRAIQVVQVRAGISRPCRCREC